MEKYAKIVSFKQIEIKITKKNDLQLLIVLHFNNNGKGDEIVNSTKTSKIFTFIGLLSL